MRVLSLVFAMAAVLLVPEVAFAADHPQMGPRGLAIGTRLANGLPRLRPDRRSSVRPRWMASPASCVASNAGSAS